VKDRSTTVSQDINEGGEKPCAPSTVVHLHLTKLCAWMINWDLHLEMIFLQLGSMNEDDQEHYGLNHRSTRYKLRYLRKQGLVSDDEFTALDGFRKYLERLLHDKEERARWIADEGEDKREAIEKAERALELSRRVMLRLPQQLKWN